MHKYEEELALITKAVYDAYQEIGVIEASIKDSGDYVTNNDIQIEKHLIKAIKGRFPSDYFLSEETQNHRELKERTWIIDPIDGTSNYVNGLGNYCTQVALYDNGEIVLSYIFVPSHNKEYYAILGGGAYLNNEPIKSNQKTNISNTLVSFIGCFRYGTPLPVDVISRAVELRMKTRVLGAVGVEFALMAEGVYSTLYTTVDNIYDIAPGLLLMKEAGCFIVDVDEYEMGKGALFVFGNKTLYEQFIKKTKEKK